MQGSVEQKQQYLRVQILEAGYDPQQFIAFMHDQTDGQTINISELTLNQLRRMVKKYKEQNPPQQSTTEQSQYPIYENQTQPQKKVQQYQKPEVPSKKVKIEYERYSPIFDYQFSSFINCVESNKLINTEYLEVAIPDFQTKETEGFLFGIGARTEYYYHIKTNLMQGTVKRISEDFDWLSSAISKLYPFLALPELEGVRKDLDEPYKQRRKDIEQYLQHLASRQFLLTSQLFIDFLTISSDKIEKYKKSYDSMGFAKGASLIKNTKGKVEVQLSNKTRTFFKSSKEFTRKLNTIHEKLTASINKMIDSYQQAVEDTYTVVSFFAEMHEAYGNLGNKYPLQKKQEFSDILVNMNNLFLGIGDSIQGIKGKVQNYAQQYYRFVFGYDKNLHKLQKTVKQAQLEYLQFKYNLSRKKDRVISDPTKWELDERKIDSSKLSKDQIKQLILPKETLAENDKKIWYAYNLKNYEHQFADYLHFHTKRYAEVFRKMCKQLLTADKTYLQTLTNFIEEARKY